MGALGRQLGRHEAKLEVQWPLFADKIHSWTRVRAKVCDIAKVSKKHCFFRVFKGSEGSGMAQVGSKMGYIGPKLAQVGQHDG